MLKKFLTDKRAVSAIEYALLASGIALAAITVVQALGVKLASTFQNIAHNI
jgi:Flp pilus assembly pilin Flp